MCASVRVCVFVCYFSSRVSAIIPQSLHRRTGGKTAMSRARSGWRAGDAGGHRPEAMTANTGSRSGFGFGQNFFVDHAMPRGQKPVQPVHTVQRQSTNGRVAAQHLLIEQFAQRLGITDGVCCNPGLWRSAATRRACTGGWLQAVAHEHQTHEEAQRCALLDGHPHVFAGGCETRRSSGKQKTEHN